MVARRGHGAGTLRQVEGGKWRAQLYLGVDPITGRRRFKSKRFTARREAERWLRSQAQDRGRGVSTAATVGEVFDLWLAHQRHRHEVSESLSRNTLDWYAGAVEKHLRPALGDLAVSEVTSANLEGLLVRKQGEGLGKSSIRRLTVTLKASMAYAVDEGWLKRSPADKLESPRMDHERAIERVWTVDQVQRFLEKVSGSPLHDLYWLMAVTGLRRAEALGLRWSAVTLPDIGAASLEVRDTWVDGKGGPRWSKPKTERSGRRIPVDDETADMLRAIRRRQHDAFGTDWSDSWPVFARPDLRPYSPSWVTHYFQRTARALGLPAIGPHGLRHSVATELGEQGVPLTVVSRLLGHSSTRVTGDVYSHVFEETAGEAVGMVARALKGPRGPA
ncbi:MAG: tyrosine-type recombinase/integrase [Actinomycetota bacterium]